jgi:hypothetical protein
MYEYSDSPNMSSLILRSSSPSRFTILYETSDLSTICWRVFVSRSMSSYDRCMKVWPSSVSIHPPSVSFLSTIFRWSPSSNVNGDFTSSLSTPSGSRSIWSQTFLLKSALRSSNFIQPPPKSPRVFAVSGSSGLNLKSLRKASSASLNE